jgi:hypothetical protein
VADGPYLTAASRYEQLKSTAVGAFLALIKLTNQSGESTEPFLIPVGAPSTQFQSSEPLDSSCCAATGDHWQPCNKAVPANAFCPILVTTRAPSRASAPGDIRSDFLKHAASHLLILKGTNLLRPILTDPVAQTIKRKFLHG